MTELRYGGKTKMYWLRFGVRVSRVRLKSQLLLILREAGRAAHFESSPNPPRVAGLTVNQAQSLKGRQGSL